MKTNNHMKSQPVGSQPAGFRTGALRASTAKTLEHRYERRKIREQLRRLDWALNAED
jgi:hypothetical protein